MSLLPWPFESSSSCRALPKNWLRTWQGAGTLHQWGSRGGAVKILIAEDDAVSRRALEGALGPCGCDLVVAGDGAEAWEVLRAPDPPRLAVLDWMMPRLDGLEVIRRVRGHAPVMPAYLIMLTCRDSRA